MENKYNEVIIVEGKNDCAHLKEIFPLIDTISVNGSEISQEAKEMIIEVSKTRPIILFFDPDYPGNRIRAIISELVPNASHAFIKKEDAISKNKKKVGVEHASKEVIINALKNKLTPSKQKSDLTMNDLFELGLIGEVDSKKKRDQLTELLHIDQPNGKTLLKRLQLLGLNRKGIEEMINENR